MFCYNNVTFSVIITTRHNWNTRLAINTDKHYKPKIKHSTDFVVTDPILEWIDEMVFEENCFVHFTLPGNHYIDEYFCCDLVV